MTITIRASYLSQYPDCPRRVAARVFADDIRKAGYHLRETVSTVAAAIGSAVHKGAAVILTDKALTGRMPPASLGTDAARDELRMLVAEGVIYDDMSRRREEAEVAALRMTSTYRDELAPWIEPILVEERLEARAGTNLVLSGQSDVIAREPGAVRDLKTGKKLGYHRPQIGAYSLLARAREIDIKRAIIDFIQRVPAKHEQPAPVSIEHDVDEVETAAMNVLRSMDQDRRIFVHGDYRRQLKPGDPWAFLANPTSKLCSAEFCRAWGTDFCREHKRS